MITTRAFAMAVAASAIASAFAFAACTGPAGTPGEQGAQGVAGPQGPPGTTDAGPIPDVGAATGCTAPCHGFGNVVDQWKYSGHYLINAMASDEPGWTSAGPCGNCHAIDGIPRRVVGDVGVADGGVAPADVTKGHMSYMAGGAVTEIGYTGQGQAAIVHCTTCHAFDSTNDPHNTGKYIPGSAPLRVASGPDDYSLIEKSPVGSTTTVGQPAGKFQEANTCVFCHKSRKDVTFYVAATNKMNSAFWGPHEGPQSDIYSGRGGYEFAGQTYGTSTHVTLANACVSCHMPPVATNQNVPDHSMQPSLTYCKTCHTTYAGTNFDIETGQSTVRAALAELEAALNAKGLLSRTSTRPAGPLASVELTDGNFDQDVVRAGSNPDGSDQVVDGVTAGALYDYFLVARGKDFGVHNPTYTKQLLWDAIKTITNANPTSLPARPE